MFGVPWSPMQHSLRCSLQRVRPRLFLAGAESPDRASVVRGRTTESGLRAGPPPPSRRVALGINAGLPQFGAQHVRAGRRVGSGPGQAPIVPLRAPSDGAGGMHVRRGWMAGHAIDPLGDDEAFDGVMRSEPNRCGG